MISYRNQNKSINETRTFRSVGLREGTSTITFFRLHDCIRLSLFRPSDTLYAFRLNKSHREIKFGVEFRSTAIFGRLLRRSHRNLLRNTYVPSYVERIRAREYVPEYSIKRLTAPDSRREYRV